MINILKGMKDRYSDDIKKYDFIIHTAKKIFSKYGFEKIITPVLEDTELFRRSVGDETDVVSKEMYEFKDKGNRSVSMRPEGTAGVVRAYLEAGFHKSDPIVKWFYNGPMYRYEAPQKGRYREFHQVGAEIFGIRSPYIDAEIIKMGCEFLEKLGIVGLTVELNSLGNLESRKKYIDDLKKFMAERLDKLSEDSKRRYEKNPLRALDSKDKGDQEQFKDAPKLYDYLDEESKKYFEDTKKYLELFSYYEKLAEVLSIKADLGVRLKTSYEASDLYTLKTICEKEIPDTIESLKIMKTLREDLWMRDAKPWGYELMDVKLGGVITRLESTKRRVLNYVDGKIPCLEELEEKRLPYFGDKADKRENRWSQIISGSDLVDTI